MAAADKERFDELMRALPAELDALEQQVRALGRAELLPLDRSYESLDRLEDFYRLALDGGAGDETLDLRVGRYVGAALVAQAGASWDYARAKADLGEPCVTNLPGLGKFRMLVMGPVKTFQRTRSMGWLRDATELHDLPHRRGQLAQLLAGLDGELAGLAADVRELTGGAAALDLTAASVAPVEAALQQLLAAGAPREQRRRVRTRAVLYLGTIVQRALGRGEWTICDDPDDGDLGQLEMHRWAPINVVRATGPGKGGFLARSLEVVISSRKEAR